MESGPDLSGSTRKAGKNRLGQLLSLPGWIYILCAVGGLVVALILSLSC
jgi:hypothetical protein